MNCDTWPMTREIQGVANIVLNVRSQALTVGGWRLKKKYKQRQCLTGPHVNEQMFLQENLEWLIWRPLLSTVNSWKLICFLHYLVTIYFVVEFKCGITRGVYRLFEVMIFFVIIKLKHFIKFFTVGTLAWTFSAMNNLGRLNNCVYHSLQASTPK